MTPGSSIGYKVVIAFGVLNVAGFGYAVADGEPWHAATHAALSLVAWGWARAIQRRRLESGSTDGEIERVQAALDDAEAALAQQASQIAELQERMDFTERVLAQARSAERKALD